MAEYVSKEEARKILCDVCGCVGCDIARCPFFQELDRLPSADVVPRADYESMEQTVYKLSQALTERKKGKWDWIGFNIECSECGCMPNFDSTEPLYNFCPNCGADMRGDGDDNKQA